MSDAPNLEEAERFLALLGSSFTFQTYDDDQEREDPKLVRVLHGTFAEHRDTLVELNANGAGIFVTVNETDLKGRKAENVVRVRAVYVDLDGAPLDPVLDWGTAPHIIVETSPGRWHVYWLVKDMALERFRAEQKKLIHRFKSDKKVHDLPRVMRLPGFVHQKGERFVSRIHTLEADLPPYDWVKPVGFEGWLSRLGNGPGLDDFNEPLLQAVAAYVVEHGSDIDREALKVRLRAEIDRAPKGPGRDKAMKKYKGDSYLDGIIEGAIKKGFGGDKDVAELNKTYAFVIVGQSDAVLEFDGDDFRLLTVTAFNNWFANKRVMIGEKSVQIAKHWLHHPQRRQYTGIVFSPGKDVPGKYNLWQGFAVQPKAGDCSKFLGHLKNNVCGGDDELYTWVVGWFADIFQNPGAKMGSALVLRGKQGVGKTIVGERIGSLLGRHYIGPVSDPRYITGRFNSHMASGLLLHADEAFWAGDRAAEGRLKDLVTGGSQFIEFKGKEPVRVDNYLRLLVCGNADWLVPAGFKERRFATLDVSDAHINDSRYFGAIVEELNNGGREALLHYLLNVDLSKVNLREIPKTAALLDQQTASFNPEQGWLFDLLERGELPWGGEPGTTPASRLFDNYIEHAKKQGVPRRAIETHLGRFLLKYIPELAKTRRIYQKGGDQVSVYVFPPLADCRAAFETSLGQKQTWTGPDEWTAVGGRGEETDHWL